MSRAEIDAFIAGLPRELSPNNGRDLAKELCRAGQLTRLQLQAVYQGKAQNLMVGNFVILERLGRGGMGQVYKARQRTMGRLAAIKVLASVAKSGEAVRRFHREMKALGRLSHPNIVTAYDADVDKGVHFLAMEYVEGKDLAALVKERGLLSVATALDCIRQAARVGLCSHAGRCASGYQACQPAVESQRYVTSPRPGIAQVEALRADDDSAHQGLTQTGQLMGTFDYMAGAGVRHAHGRRAVRTSTASAARCIFCWSAAHHSQLKPWVRNSSRTASSRCRRCEPCASDVPEGLDRISRRCSPKTRTSDSSRWPSCWTTWQTR